MEKLKNRLDAFSDGIMAVIITIMVLDISPILHDSWPNYLSMGKHIGIYLITFVFVFNMWYQHSTAFAEIDTMTYRILIWEVAFLAVLSLMPVFTSMMAENTTRITVILYGIMQAIINLVFRELAKSIIHLQYTTKADMQQVYRKIYGNANHWLDGLSIVAIVTGYFFPHATLVFYLAYPILSFLINADARQQMYDATALPADEQEDLAKLPASDYVDWRKTARRIWHEQSTSNESADRGQTPTSAAPSPESKTPDATSPLPPWAAWLDQIPEGQRKRRLHDRLDDASPEQKAQMAAWFDQHRQVLQRRKQQGPNEHR
ncbi:MULTISPECIES: TMEM175 family protein [unclassified Lacticaseibacillus]|uniref:TMEM175 family protein n=1 Tax=unclassified Lacticaseibacillus TaxID=2759744 RepID=UPI0019426437|nr:MULTISPECIES: TMEM175 family protein [unclassified Lacticaseibacillus]